MYLLVDDRLTLIDTGLPGNSASILRFITNVGREPRELAHIVVTHGHIDHAGSAADLRRLTGAKIVFHRDEAVHCPDGAPVIRTALNRRTSPAYRVLSRIGRFEPCPVDVLVDDGDIISSLGGLRIIHTPGHTPGNMCLLIDKLGILIVGDTIINNKDRLSRPLPFGADREQSEKSLTRLAQFDFSICCFGHGPPLTCAAAAAVRDLAGYHPSTPLWRRVVRGHRALVRFGLRVGKRPNRASPRHGSVSGPQPPHATG